MTPRGLPEESVGQQAAEADTSPFIPAEAAGQVQAEPAAPDDAERLKEEIGRTREQLGQTVEQLAAKTDVKTMARAKSAQLTGKAKSTTARARDQGAARVRTVQGQFAGTTAMARQSARRVVAKGRSAATEYRLPLALAAVAVIMGSLGAWRLRKPQADWHAERAGCRRR
jgi:hypothetical protein